MSNWQPIETAPKDGTLFLAVYLHHRLQPEYGIIRWCEKWDIDAGAWTDQFCDQSWNEPYKWQPLPEAPNE